MMNKRIIKVIRVSLVLIVLSIIYHLFRFQLKVSNNSVSESLFIISLPFSLISLIKVTGAGSVFNGISFVTKSLGKNFRDKYPKYHDYYEERLSEKNTPNYRYYFLIISIIQLIISVIFGVNA